MPASSRSAGAARSGRSVTTFLRTIATSAGRTSSPSGDPFRGADEDLVLAPRAVVVARGVARAREGQRLLAVERLRPGLEAQATLADVHRRIDEGLLELDRDPADGVDEPLEPLELDEGVVVDSVSRA